MAIKGKSVVNTQNIRIKESKHTAIKSYQTVKEDSKIGRKKGPIKHSENNK